MAEFVEGLSQNDSAFEILVGQGRIFTTRSDLAVPGKAPALIAVGDPTVIDFAVLNSRQIRLIGQRIGVTDLSITTPENETYNFEVRVVANLHVLRGQLHSLFPDASLRLSQIRDAVVVEGQARDSAQVARIMETIRAYLQSVAISQAREISGRQGGPGRGPTEMPPQQPPADPMGQPGEPDAPLVTGPEESPVQDVQATIGPPQVINLITVPGSQQVLLKVRVAELNRTAFRQIGADFLAVNSSTGTVIGTQIGGAGVTASAVATRGVLASFAQTLSSASTSAFAVFEQADFALLFSALRRNSLLKILAEPNLVAVNGQAASFLAGGEFPVPVPQNIGGVGGSATVTVQFKEFGVRLGFVPTILDNGVIRLSVDPEVSTIDFSIGTVLVPGGTPVPGLNTRKLHTVVEMRQGETLAVAGLLQLSLDGNTQRIPGLGSLPILGQFFSNTTNTRMEKELIVLVTPYLIEPMQDCQVPPTPGDEVKTPTDLEFYLLHRIEGHTQVDFRSTTDYESRLPVLRCLLRLDEENVRGPHGYCDD